MISATQATTISDAVVAGDNPPSVASTARQGNELLDEMNVSVIFAGMKGLRTAYLNVSKYPDITVGSASATLTGLGYTVDNSRLRYYKEIVVVWP